VQNHFTLLGLPVAFEVDAALLDRNYRRLQGQWHPDRFAAAAAPERLAALQQTSLLNDAYATLKSPLRRAEHLLQLHDVDVAVMKQAELDGAFLLAQMELRDELEALVARGDERGMQALGKRVAAELAGVCAEFAGNIRAAQFQAAKPVFHKLQFLQKLSDEIAAAEDRLLD
jgi:molecular chaperone HscB